MKFVEIAKEKLNASAAMATAAEQEDAARRNLEKRNEYRRSAMNFSKQTVGYQTGLQVRAG